MKLSSVFTKLTFGKATVLKTLGALAVAGVAMTVATPAAKAQVGFGVEIGRPHHYAPTPAPVYVAPAYGYGYDAHPYLDQPRAEEWRAQQWRERENFEHHRDFDRDRRHDDRGWR